MNMLPVIKYLIGLGIFGFVYWLLDGVLTLFIGEGIHVAGATWNLMHALWTGGLLCYLIFGGWWVIRSYNEKDTYRGMM